MSDYPLILRGCSIQQVDGETVIFQTDGQRWHAFGKAVDMDLAKAVLDAYRAGFHDGVSHGKREKADEIRSALGMLA